MYSKSLLQSCGFFIDVQAGAQVKANTTNPTGKVDISKLLSKEDDFWETQVSTQSLEKRVVVITDWSLRDAYVSVSTKNWITSLKTNAFEIYLWTGELVEIDSYYDLTKAINNILPIHPSHVEKSLALKGIEKDRVKIIDYFERRRIEKLFKGETDLAPVLNVHDIDKGFSSTFQEGIFNSLSSYLFFEVYVAVSDRLNYDLLLKCAQLPQSRGLFCCMDGVNAVTMGRFIAWCDGLPKGISTIWLYHFEEAHSKAFDTLFKHKALNKLKKIRITEMIGSQEHGYDFSAFSEQLISIEIEKVVLKDFRVKSFNLLQHLKLNDSHVSALQKIIATAPNIKTLHLKKLYVPEDFDNNNIELLKLKTLHLENLSVSDVLKTVTITSQLDELVLDDVKFITHEVFENLTQLKKLSIKDTAFPVELFTVLIKNNNQLEKIRLDNVRFLSIYSESCSDEMAVTELLCNYSHCLPSLRSIEVLQSDPSDNYSLISTILSQLTLIEEIKIAQSEGCSIKNKIEYQKNHQILLQGSDIELACLNLFLQHSDLIEHIDINSTSITTGLLIADLKAHLHKLAQLQSLILPGNLDEIEPALWLIPTLKQVKFKNVDLFYGRLTLAKKPDFKMLLDILKANNLGLSELITNRDSDAVNEALLLEYSGIFPFKSLVIRNDNLSEKVISKLINNSPYLESLTLDCNLQGKVIHVDALSNCLENLMLGRQSTESIRNILKCAPFLKHVEFYLKEENESFFMLLKPFIAASNQLQSLKITGNLPLKLSRSILDCLIKSNYKMHTIILDEHFIFDKERLIVKIPTNEDYLYKLIQSSPQLIRLHINQSIPIQTMLQRHQRVKLESVSLVSCLDSHACSKSTVETFDFLLSVCPNLSKVSLNIYSQQSFVIIDETSNGFVRLRSSESLSTQQIASYLRQISGIRVLEIKAINGVFLAEQFCTQINPLKIILKDTPSLLNNMHVLTQVFSPCDRSFVSPYVKLTDNILELHPDKLSKEDMLEVLKLLKTPHVSTLVFHNALTPALVNALRDVAYKYVHLVNVPCDAKLISQLIKDEVTLTAKNASLQVLYTIDVLYRHSIKYSGVRFPPALFMEYDARIGRLELKNISFDVHSQWPKDEKDKLQLLYLNNANISVECLEHLLTYCSTAACIEISNCPSLSGIPIDEFSKKYPNLTIKPIDSDTDQEYPTEHSFVSNHSALDANTGTQSPDDDFSKKQPIWFRQKSNGQPYPNYLRDKVEYVGQNTINPCKFPTIVDDVVTLYEEKFVDNPDYYLSELVVSAPTNTWTALPSLTPEDALEAFDASEAVELGYSDKTNLFYIRCQQSRKIEIAYIVHAKLAIRYSDKSLIAKYQNYFPCIQSINFEKNTIDESFKEQFLALQKAPLRFREELLIAFCNFDVGDLSNSSLKGDALLNLIIRERKGVCRHNVIAFEALKKFFNQNVPSRSEIKARVISSAIHVFIEMKHTTGWEMICLGGADMPEAFNHQKKDFAFEKEMVSKPCDLKSELNQKPLLLETSSFDVNNKKISSQSKDIPLNALSIKTQEVINQPQDFSYVLALNPFKPSKALKTLPAANFSELAQQVIDLATHLNPGENNILLSFESSSQIEQFYAAMAATVNANNRRFLTIHSLNQFNAAEFVIDYQTHKPLNQPSALVKSAQHAKSGDFLVVNVSNYDENTVSQLNALTDRKARVLANQPLHDAITLIAVKLNQTEVDNDVYSRFLNAAFTIPCLAPQTIFESFCKPVDALVSDEERVVVDFYDGAAWKSQLLGGLNLNGRQLEYKKGALIRMLEAGKSCLRLYNPPMELEDFRVFLINLLHTRQFDANGITYHLPKDFYYESATKTYNLSSLEYVYELVEADSNNKDNFVLNATTYHHLFNNVYCSDGMITQTPGWLVQYANQALVLRVTGLLHEALWARIFDAANPHQCQLRLSFESSVLIPQSMRNRKVLSNGAAKELRGYKNHIIISNDLYFAQCQYQAKDNIPVMVFDINENTGFSDLFELIRIRKHTEDLALDWHSCPVREHLLAGHRVILKGCLNQELADKLQALFSDEERVLVNGQYEAYTGQLILLLDKNKYFHAATVIRKTYGLDDFYQQLATIFPKNILNSWKLLFEAFLQKAHAAGISLDFNYLTIKSMLGLYQNQPHTNSFLPFILLHPKYKVLKQLALTVCPEPIDESQCAEAFDAHRKRRVSSVLDFFASGFLVGDSGVGKTTFVKHAFKHLTVHVGLENLKQWAKEGGLFYLDETNLYECCSLDFFAGLFNTRPGILLHNTFYPIKLGLTHQILFGGNYSHYANRQTHDFLQQVPVVEFEDFPDWYLKEKVLKKAGLSNDIMNILLKVYRHVNQRNANAGWTVRNLENMALRFLLFTEKRPHQAMEAAAWLSAYDELSNHNDVHWVGIFQDWIEAQYPVKSMVADLNRYIHHKNDNFILTDCRKNGFRLMQDQVAIQSIKTKYPQLRDFGAVCGVLLEGESGLGKSKLAVELAKSLGYCNGDIPTQANSKCYYFISHNPDEPMHFDKPDELGQSLQLSPIEQKLTALFHAGALVIIDEFSSFRLEKILNALMSGVDLSMQPAKNPGFFVIATQNPIHYVGRKKLGTPLENRLFKLDFLDYSQHGLYQIAQHEGLHPFFSKASAAFFHQSSVKHKTSAAVDVPNFRGYLEKIKTIKVDNPISTWFFLDRVYSFLDQRDRQALHCASLFCLSAFAFAHQPALLYGPVKEQIVSVNPVEQVVKILEEESFEQRQSSEEEESTSYEESSNEEKNLLDTHEILELTYEEDEIGQEACFNGISMQILGGFIAVLGAATVAVSFVLLNATTFGLAGFIALTAVGGVTALVGLGLFTAGVVRTCSEPPGLEVVDPRRSA